MTASQYTAVVARIDELMKELFLTRESLAVCQARCQVRLSSADRLKGFAANFLTAAFGATVAFALNRAFR